MSTNKEYAGKVYRGQQYVFEILKEDNYIGAGGNGNVFCARCESLKGEFVIKILKPKQHYENQKRYKERILRFDREMEVMAKINMGYKGRYILPLIDSCSSEETEKWYVTPKAVCLTEWLKKDVTVPFNQKFEWCMELCKLLESLHALKYYHRDIKPSNIFILDNTILLGDFGLVWNESFSDLTMLAEAIGPQSTKPPECYRGYAYAIPNELQYAVDVYELAKTIWMILSGKDKNCFNGSYICGLKDVSLELSDINGVEECSLKTLGPLHDVLEMATMTDPSLRPKMNKFVAAMNNLVEVNKDENKIKEAELKVLAKKFINKNKAEIQGYHSIKEIVGLLDSIKERIKLELDDFKDIIIRNCYEVDSTNNIMCIKDTNGNEYILAVTTLFVNQASIVSEDFRLMVKYYDFSEVADYNEYQSIRELPIMPGVVEKNKKIRIDHEETIMIRMK